MSTCYATINGHAEKYEFSAQTGRATQIWATAPITRECTGMTDDGTWLYITTFGENPSVVRASMATGELDPAWQLPTNPYPSMFEQWNAEVAVPSGVSLEGQAARGRIDAESVCWRRVGINGKRTFLVSVADTDYPIYTYEYDPQTWKILAGYAAVQADRGNDWTWCFDENPELVTVGQEDDTYNLFRLRELLVVPGIPPLPKQKTGYPDWLSPANGFDTQTSYAVEARNGVTCAADGGGGVMLGAYTAVGELNPTPLFHIPPSGFSAFSCTLEPDGRHFWFGDYNGTALFRGSTYDGTYSKVAEVDEGYLSAGTSGVHCPLVDFGSEANLRQWQRSDVAGRQGQVTSNQASTRRGVANSYT